MRTDALDLAAALRLLAERGITRLMVEAGPILSTALLRADLVDEAALFRSPATIGAEGIDALDGVAAFRIDTVAAARALGERSVGDDSLDLSSGRARPMFTGIVTDIGELIAVEPRARESRPPHHRLRLRSRNYRYRRLDRLQRRMSDRRRARQRGNRGWFAVDAAAETLRVTTAGRWRAGTRINLERALKVGDELGGHMVAGMWTVLPSSSRARI